MVVDFDIALCIIDLVANLLTIYHARLLQRTLMAYPRRPAVVLETGGFLESTPKHTTGKYREKGRSEDEKTFESTIGSTFFD